MCFGINQTSNVFEFETSGQSDDGRTVEVERTEAEFTELLQKLRENVDIFF